MGNEIIRLYDLMSELAVTLHTAGRHPLPYGQCDDPNCRRFQPKDEEA